MRHKNHALHYINLHPEPVQADEPHPLAVLAGAAFTTAGLYLLTVVLFSL